MRENSPLRRLIKMAAEEMADPGLQAMADAGDIAKGPAGMPGIKMHPEKADGKDESKDVMRVAHELDAKTKEIAGLRQQLQEAKMDAQRVQVKAEITNEQTKMREGLRQEQQRMLEGLRREQERMYAQIRQEQKELDKRQSELQIAEAQQKGEITAAKAEYEAGHTAAQAQYEAQFTAAEAQNRANMAIAQAQHQAQLDKDVSAHDAQIAQSKADSLMDIAQQTTDMYIKQTEKARADADKYFSTQQQQYSASHPVISPALQSRLDGAMQSVGRVGKALNSMTSMSKLGRAMRDLEKVTGQEEVPWASEYTTPTESAKKNATKMPPHSGIWMNPRTGQVTEVPTPSMRSKNWREWIKERDKKGLAEREEQMKREGRQFTDLGALMADYSEEKMNALARASMETGDWSVYRRAKVIQSLQPVLTQYIKTPAFNLGSPDPFAGGDSMATRGSVIAHLLNVRKALENQARLVPYQEGVIHPKEQIQVLDDVLEDYRRYARNYYRYINEMRGDVNLPMSVRNRHEKAYQEYVDYVRGVNPGGVFEDDDPLEPGRTDYSHSDWTVNHYDPHGWNTLPELELGRRSPFSVAASAHSTYEHNRMKSFAENLKENLNPATGLIDRTHAMKQLDDFYQRHSRDADGNRRDGIVDHSWKVIDYNPMSLFDSQLYPHAYGMTHEAQEENAKNMERANHLYGSYSGLGAYLGNIVETVNKAEEIPFALEGGMALSGAVKGGVKQLPGMVKKFIKGEKVPPPEGSAFQGAMNGLMIPFIRDVVTSYRMRPYYSNARGEALQLTNYVDKNGNPIIKGTAEGANRLIPFPYRNAEGTVVGQ